MHPAFVLVAQCLCLLIAPTTSASLQSKVKPKVNSSSRSRSSSKSIICNELPENVLSDILGPAFNSRYMSIDTPLPEDLMDDLLDEDGVTSTGSMGKRRVGLVPPFYVEDDYARVIADEPAWSVNHVAAIPPLAEAAPTSRRRRSPAGKSAKGAARQWECESRIAWIDLGADYFPRYLRSVECTSKTCWYGHYKCRPRSFTVKILRRKSGRCTVAKAGHTLGAHGLPSELRELWVWEERAVNFCCDCAL